MTAHIERFSGRYLLAAAVNPVSLRTPELAELCSQGELCRVIGHT